MCLPGRFKREGVLKMANERPVQKPDAMRQPLVLFSLDHQRYAIALDRVRRSIRVVAITPLPEMPAIVLGVIDLGGTVIPVINLRKRFNHPARDLRLSDHILIVATEKRTVGLLVDETIGVIEAVSGDYTATGEVLPGLEYIEGVLRLEDGLILIHDLDRLLSLDEEDAIDRALEAKSEYASSIDMGSDENPGNEEGDE